MKDLILKPNMAINVKGLIISIGFRITEVAIVSTNTYRFVELKQARVSKRLRKVKNKFRHRLNSSEQFCFSFMTEPEIEELITILK